MERRFPISSGRFPKDCCHSNKPRLPLLRVSLLSHPPPSPFVQGSDIAADLNAAFRALTFQAPQYAKTFSNIVWKIPKGMPSLKQAVAASSPCISSFPSLYDTTTNTPEVPGLIRAKELELIQRFNSTPPKGPVDTRVFIYGGISGVD